MRSHSISAAARRRAIVLTPVFTETWTAVDGSGWPYPKWTTQLTGGSTATTTIQSNAGVLNIGSSAYSGKLVQTYGMTPAANTDLIITFTIGGTQDIGYFTFSINSDGTTLSSNSYWPQNGYSLQIITGVTAGTSQVRLDKEVGNVQTSLLAATTRSIAVGTTYKLRMQRVGTTFQYRIWLANGSEPGAWDASVVDGGTQPPNGVLTMHAGNDWHTINHLITYDDLTISIF